MRDQKVFLNGVDLQSAHPAVLLQHIHDNGAALDVRTADRAGAAGQFLTGWRVQNREITIDFAIRERLDFTVRADAVNAVTAWAARGGWLELSDRPGLRMWVALKSAPSLGKLRDWTADLSLTFEAHAWPFWTEAIPAVTAVDGATNRLLTVTVPGTWETRLEAEITPVSAALTSVSIDPGEDAMTISNLNLAAGKTLRIWWDERHLLHIVGNNIALLSHRTGGDLTVWPGVVQPRVIFNTACDVRIWARGCFL